MIEIKKMKGGVCAARGFVAGASGCGIKNGKVMRDDVAVVFSESPATSAATFTTNKVKAAPVRISSEHLKAGANRAVILKGVDNSQNPGFDENGFSFDHRLHRLDAAPIPGEKLFSISGQTRF